MKILVINGPNLNFLGIRDTSIYGKEDYNYLVDMIKRHAALKNIEVECFQSNHEGAIIDKIQEAYLSKVDGIVINPGAYTHYSYAIHDALCDASGIYKVEIHISDIYAREDFRKISVTRPACDDQIVGEGLNGYILAMDKIIEK